jgi:prevent-host-death family protein
MYMPSISVTEARAALPSLIDRVEAGEEVTITRHGRPVAVLVSPSSLPVRRAALAFRAARTVREARERAGGRTLSSTGGLDLARAEQLIEDVEAGRRST